MKILVYGAGVLGSYLAHALLRGGNDVTLLARGKRMRELQESGLVIRHYLQCRTTVDKIRLYDDFCMLKKRSGILTPAWDELEQYMVKSQGDRMEW
jgi:ketopantoate reductase